MIQRKEWYDLMDNFSEFFEKFAKKEPKHRRVIGQSSTAVSIIISLVITLLIGGIYFYLELPAINLMNEELYITLIILSVIFTVCMTLFSHREPATGSTGKKVFKYVFRQPVAAVIIILSVLTLIIGSVIGVPLFRAKDYSNILSTTPGDFAEDVSEIDWNQIPLLDSDSANRLANRKLGELSELVSQFTVSTDSAQINYKNVPVRVTYLDYSDFFKWMNNQSEGIPAYITIDMRTQDVDVVRLEKPMKYSPSEYFGRDLMRHLRFSYPTYMFDDVNFEIDDEGTPYWVASVMTKTIGLFGGRDIKGAVLLNAITGESEYYATGEIPTWVDRVYNADLLIEQYDYTGLYKNGFINSLFNQTGCTATTEGYNYIALNDDVWMYTGITSVTSDEGNIGFILVNQRTKEAKYYTCAGAEEYSARDSAEGAVQQYGYVSTFPLLLNIADQPTYFMSLKDGAGLVKMYAMVNVQQYQIVATGYSLNECQEKYHKLLEDNGLANGEKDENEGTKKEKLTLTGTLVDLRQANIDGNTVYYLMLEGSDVYFTVSAKKSPDAPLLDVGDKVTVEYYEAEGKSIVAVEKMTFENVNPLAK